MQLPLMFTWIASLVQTAREGKDDMMHRVLASSEILGYVYAASSLCV